ncbi:YHYH protein [Tenacibaculum sp. E3R01]|uniref:YHYH protein n=1 Tax=unclassified Tenacibaculum TaxID=2635139 RepID=UPI00089745EB|nr:MULTISPECIES: YHYH protein [unclassified Tenacibaculum]RBW56656.1 YHYH protein [Tenacibaculum sp. E3R01]SEE54628.1 YHYH protein [Tenacibaculum sp. MAR_2010_89]
MKNYKIMMLLFAFLSFGCSSDEDNLDSGNDQSTSDTVYDIRSIVSKFDNIDGVTYSINGDFLEITTNGLPDHKSPYWEQGNVMYEAYNGTNPNWNKNPNTIQAQNITFKIPLYPKEATIKEATSLGPIGISLNGVAFFNQYAGPNNQPLTNEINSFDQYLGHPQNSGQYHYHIEPVYLTSKLGKSSFLGLLADGFPVYGPEENGGTITNSDLDDYHGHVSVTPDFPNGIYHYHITSDDPYLNGSGYYGTPGNVSQ